MAQGGQDAIRWWAARAATLSLLTMSLLSGCTRTLHDADFLYPSKRGVIPDGIDRLNLEIAASDSTRLRGWLLRPANPRGNLIYFYGNQESVRDSERRIYWLAHRYQLAVAAIDYRGYGFSDGSPVGDLLFRDATTVYDSLRRHFGTGSGPTLVYGRSLGSFMALHLAARRPIDGMILEGTVTSLRDALPSIKRMAPWYIRWLLTLRLGEDLSRYQPPVEEIRGLSTPVLLIHGERDELFPIALSRTVYDNSPAKIKRWCPVPGIGHNDLSISDEPVLGCLDEFFAIFGAPRVVARRWTRERS